MTTHPVKRRKKLSEVATPLEAIHAASAREKSIRHGHPSTSHLWWTRPNTRTRPGACQPTGDFCHPGKIPLQ
jgi:spore germination cell wall hydrolase CwlJ-like protein